MKYIFIITFILFTPFFSKAQYQDIYPISENSSIRGFGLQNGYPENILFEAKPVLKLKFFNNIANSLVDSNGANYSNALYLSFEPQIRMYEDQSVPVKTPSYKLLLGYQALFKRSKYHFFSGAIEHGHYSNGQSGCTYSEEHIDGSPECILIHNTIHDQTNLSDILNRKNGEFSTNLTRLIFVYRDRRFNKARSNKNEPWKYTNIPKRVFSYSLDFTLRHKKLLLLADIGGYQGNAVDIFGKYKTAFKFKYTVNYDVISNQKRDLAIASFVTSAKIEHLKRDHKSVVPLRLELSLKLFFKLGFGLVAGANFGHDDYNIRVVDNVNQIYLGLEWDMFALRKILMLNPKKK